ELTPLEIIESGSSGSGGPAEVRHRAHVAFSTVEELLNNLEKVHNRRKALVYVSDGYDFNPYSDARFGKMALDSPFAQNENAKMMNQAAAEQQTDGQPYNPANDPKKTQEQMGEEFADADLARELGDLTRTANRANVTMYKIDPRGLVGMADIDQQVDPSQGNEYVRKSPDSLRVIAGETGGIAVVNQIDLRKALKK